MNIVSDTEWDIDTVNNISLGVCLCYKFGEFTLIGLNAFDMKTDERFLPYFLWPDKQTTIHIKIYELYNKHVL